MKIRIALVFLTLCASLGSATSQSQYKNGIFAEIGGNAYWYSINYERQLPKTVVLRGGLGYAERSYWIPITVEKIYGKKNHHFDVGGGLLVINYYQTNNGVPTRRTALAATGVLGYRYQKPDKRFFLKVAFTPAWVFYDSDPYEETSEKIYPWGGIGAGTRF
jgi:hypothetical protein